MWQDLTKQFGPVYTFWMGYLPMVVVTDWNLIKQHFIKEGHLFTGREQFPVSIEMRRGCYGIIETFGDRWLQQRRFAIHVLRDFGMGRNLMEEKVLCEVQAMIDHLKKVQNVPFDMANILDSSVGSIINSFLFGYRFDENNIHEFLTLKSRLDKHMRIAMTPVGILIAVFPSLGNFPFFKQQKALIMDNMGGLFKMFREVIDEKLRTIDYDNDEYSDYVEAFLKERKKHEHEPNFGGFEMEQLDSVCFDLWIAGMETTSNTLYWALLYVMLNPEVREKIYEELDREIGSDRIITTSDKSNLNYINATINESQRMANLLPMNLQRKTSEEVKVGNFTIPANTVVLPQISSVLYDETYFPNPSKFNPSRFLENGQLLKIEQFVPFSIGKRQCLGEGLAKLELFLFFANLFNQFEISLDPSGGVPSTEKQIGIAVRAKNFQILLKSR
ncbi:unnamed protein product [Caenorhabditis angaria]|uniref:CYtochrome P450 family n=1 Tax=Caenorhabditis angaria TaxID=860376 RepID=A0A9P1IPE9_9PELO|nr:unnamed protein product [Caenorhabditis angaria]